MTGWKIWLRSCSDPEILLAIWWACLRVIAAAFRFDERQPPILADSLENRSFNLHGGSSASVNIIKERGQGSRGTGAGVYRGRAA
jgi:hypothetical protein